MANEEERTEEVSIPRLDKFVVPKQDLNIAILPAFQDLGYDKPTAEQAKPIHLWMGCLGDLADWRGEIYVFRDLSTRV